MLKNSLKIEQWKKKLLNARTPKSYIALSRDSGLPQGIKAELTRQWLIKKKYTIDDIIYARNRDPYWKKLKCKGSGERSVQRFLLHNYSDTHLPKKWRSSELLKFVHDTLTMTDVELAKKFKTTIPSVQGVRRRINLGKKISQKKGLLRITKKRLASFAAIDEQKLRKILKK